MPNSGMVDAGLDPGHDGDTFSSAECHHWGSLIAQLDDLCIVIGVQQCITTEVAANIPKNLDKVFCSTVFNIMLKVCAVSETWTDGPGTEEQVLLEVKIDQQVRQSSMIVF